MSGLLYDDVEQAISHSAHAFERAKANLSAGISIFGAGCHGRAALKYLRRLGVDVQFFVDNNPAIQGNTVEGVKVIGPDALAGECMVFIAARHAVDAVEAQLNHLGIANISFDEFFVHDQWLRLLNLRDSLLGDHRSRQVINGLILAMLTGHKGHCVEVMDPNQYFVLPQFYGSVGEHFVDAGAFVGDSTERFLWANNGAFASVHAFEPGAAQFLAMRRRIERLQHEWAIPEGKITCVQAGLGATSGPMSFAGNDQLLQSGGFGHAESGEPVMVHALDDYLDGRPATFIKADVEGMELDLLKGAARTIAAFRPKLAISVYHEPEHLFTIAEHLREQVPQYRMALRHHAASLMETILYCWVD